MLHQFSKAQKGEVLAIALSNILVISVLVASAWPNDPAVHRDAALVLATEIDDIPVTDIDPTQTLLPATLPEGIQPLRSAEPEVEPFLGVWRGQWEGTLDAYFIITEAEGQRVKVFNSWGANAIVSDSGMRFIWGTIFDGILLLPGENVSESLRLQEDGTLFGLYYSQSVHMPSRIILTRQTSP